MQDTLAKIEEAVNRKDKTKTEQMELAKLDRMHLIWCSMLDAMGMTAETGGASQTCRGRCVLRYNEAAKWQNKLDSR